MNPIPSACIPSFQHMAAELRVFAGPSSLQALSKELDRHGCRRAVLICGHTLAALPEVLGPVRKALGSRLCAEFAHVRAHSPTTAIYEAARVLADARADSVLAVGGGSAIVTARSASIVMAEGSNVEALCTRRGPDGKLHSPRLPAPKLPQFVIPTTPTTACVKAGSAVLDEGSGQRLTLFDPKTRAKVICLHPQLLATASFELLEGASLNTMTMAAEGLESADADPLSDALLMHALRLIAEHLPGPHNASTEVERRLNLALAAVLCGRGTDVAGGGLASALGHVIGPRVGVANGIVNAVVLPHTLRFNSNVVGGRQGRIASSLGGFDLPSLQSTEPAIESVTRLLRRLNVPRRLRDLGLAHDALPAVAAAAMDDWFTVRNPRTVEGPAEVQQLLEAAW